VTAREVRRVEIAVMGLEAQDVSVIAVIVVKVAVISARSVSGCQFRTTSK
jgi:hypothetical protein